MVYRINDPHATKLMMKYAQVKSFDPTRDWSIAHYDSQDCLLGGAIFDSYTGVGGSVEAHLCAFRPRWATKRLLYSGFYYCFEVLKVKKIISLMAESNWKSYRLTIHLGFKEEALIPDVFPWQPSGYYVHSMYKEDCKWLKMNELLIVGDEDGR